MALKIRAVIPSGDVIMDSVDELLDLFFLAGEVVAGICMAYGAYLVWEHQRNSGQPPSSATLPKVVTKRERASVSA